MQAVFKSAASEFVMSQPEVFMPRWIASVVEQFAETIRQLRLSWVSVVVSGALMIFPGSELPRSGALMIFPGSELPRSGAQWTAGEK